MHPVSTPVFILYRGGRGGGEDSSTYLALFKNEFGTFGTFSAGAWYPTGHTALIIQSIHFYIFACS